MHQREMVMRGLVPADQHAPAAMPPTMCAPHAPPSCRATSLLRERRGRFPPRPAVGRQAELGQPLTPLVVVIVLVLAHPLCWLRAGRRARDRDAGARLPDHLAVMPIGVLDGEANGDAAAISEDAPCVADLAEVGRILAHLFPPQAGV
jgi:hypothetical protein